MDEGYREVWNTMSQQSSPSKQAKSVRWKDEANDDSIVEVRISFGCRKLCGTTKILSVRKVSQKMYSLKIQLEKSTEKFRESKLSPRRRQPTRRAARLQSIPLL